VLWWGGGGGGGDDLVQAGLGQRIHSSVMEIIFHQSKQISSDHVNTKPNIQPILMLVATAPEL